jgi:hypothetical protein
MGDVYFSLEPTDPSFLTNWRVGSKVFAQADRLKPEAFFLGDGPAARPQRRARVEAAQGAWKLRGRRKGRRGLSIR